MEAVDCFQPRELFGSFQERVLNGIGPPPREGEAARRAAYLDGAGQDCLLDLGDSLGHLDASWASVGAVEGGAAAPHAFLVVQDLQTHVSAFVTRIEDEAVRVDDRGWAEVLAVGPEHWAGAGARSAQDALGGVVEDFAFFGRLDALLGWLVALGDQEWHDLAVGLEERFHVHDQVLLQRQTLDGFNGDWLGGVKVLEQGLAGQAVAAVDAHRIGTADAVGAGPAEGQRTVVVPLDLVQGVQHTVGAVHGQLEVFPVGFGAGLWQVAANTQGDVEGWDFSAATDTGLQLNL